MSDVSPHDLAAPHDTVNDASPPPPWLEVHAVDLEAQGVARRPDGKVVFIEGRACRPSACWPTCTARKAISNMRALTAVLRESAQRVQPACPHFGLHAGACGGCKMQHLHVAAQVAVKQRVLEDNLWHLGRLRPERVLRPIEGPAWGYRDRGRLSVRYVRKKGEVLVGFHERKSRYVADMRECRVLPPHVSALLLPLRALVGAMDARETLPQIELAVGADVTALVLRHMEPLSAGDIAQLRAFAHAHGVQWWLQPKGPDTVHLLDEGGPQLSYRLPEYGIEMPYRPTDFTQVNAHINRVLVHRALGLLQVQRDERVIDWFCGLGNFSLPLATRAREVLGIEGSEALVARSRDNYRRNAAMRGSHGPLAPTRFAARNLFEMTPEQLVADGTAQKWLVDPPREGAHALVQALAQLRQEGPERADWQPPRRIVYVSCNPATLARDAGILVNEGGYRCVAAGAVNMFPHTAHVESIAQFELVPR
ncbi:MAG: 23S rRNA (uracil(1939)-C(5))-methyltransferase RlmD [Pseudorhodoferax sp.]